MIGKSTPTDRVTLRPFGREDFSRLISWLPTEADLIEWCAAFFHYPLTDAQLERYLESTRQPNSRVVFTARSPGVEAVGHIEISQIWPHLSTRLSRVLVAPDQRRQGFASSMVAQALLVSFDQYFVDRVDVGVSATNSAATGCYAKLGFKPVGKWPQRNCGRVEHFGRYLDDRDARYMDSAPTLSLDRWAERNVPSGHSRRFGFR
jgi:RimJ/RimL family protein N-acetyltransferase